MHDLMPVRRQVSLPSKKTSLNLYQEFLEELFITLVNNKQLPKYQFERRIDAILSLFLPELLSTYFRQPVEIVVPEFPIKKSYSNRSTNVDYLLFRRASEAPQTEAWIFFELKTDDSSVRPDQLQTYIAAKERGMPKLYQELLEITKATRQRQKYVQLVRRVEQFPVNRPVDIELVYLAPTKLESRPSIPNLHTLTFSQFREVELKQHAEIWSLFRSIVMPVL